MYRELAVNSDTDLVKLLWDTFPDWRESEIEELVDGGWVKVGDEIAQWGWLIYRGESVIIDKPDGDPAVETNANARNENDLPSVAADVAFDAQPTASQDQIRSTLEMSERDESIQPEMTTSRDHQDGPSPFSTDFQETVAAWQRRLLQLDRNNNLLYFRPGRTAIRIVDQTTEGILSKLLSSSRGLSFDYAEPRVRRSGGGQLEDGDDGGEEEVHVIPGDLRGDHPPLELQRRLGNLRRRDREWEEEQGLNVLFLALGFLRWVDQDGEQASAPLLILPCDLHRTSPHDPFILMQDNEDLTTNSTLAVKLGEFGIELPDNESEVEDVRTYLNMVRQSIASRSDWKVEDEIYLATFAYSKLAMWRDLETIRERGTDHSVVRALAGAEPHSEQDATPSALKSLMPQDLSGAQLDDVLDVRDQFAILPADYSQLLAINSAIGGNNLVIHGPPGTGKSQTIANMIATFMADGKSVLFVSEKTAALDVVKRRLDENQLGVFCLDLHSERGKKTNVYRQLRESVDDPRTVRRLDFDYAALSERRRQLNRLVRTLHQIRQPLGRTAFQVHGRFATIRGVPHVPIEVKDIEALDQDHLHEILDAANRIRLRTREFREHWTSHWHILKTGSPSLELANMIRQDMQSFTAAIDKVQSVAPGLAVDLGLSNSSTLNDVGNLQAVALQLATAPGIPLGWMNEGVASRLRVIADNEAGLQRTRAILSEQLVAMFGDPIPDRDYAGIAEELAFTPEEDRSLQNLLGVRWGQKLIQGQQCTATFQHLKTALVRLKSIAGEVSDFLDLEPTDLWIQVAKWLEVIQTIARLGPVPPTWTQIRGTETVATRVEEARRLTKDIEEKETHLFSALEPSVLNVVDHNMLVRYRTNHQSRLGRLLGSSYRSDRRSIRAFRIGGETTSFSEELKFVEEIVEMQLCLEAWHEMVGALTLQLEHRYAGRETNWEAVLQDIGDVEALLEGWPGNRRHLIGLLTGEDGTDRARELILTLESSCAELENFIQTGLDPNVCNQVKEGSLTLSSLGDLVQDATLTTKRIEDAVNEPLGDAQETISDLKQFRDLMESGAQLTILEREHYQAENALKSDFGARFKSFKTDWSDIVSSLAWTDELLKIVEPAKPSAVLIDHAVRPQGASFY